MTSFQRSKVIAERIEYGETNLPVPPGGPPYPPSLTRPAYLIGSCGHQLDSVAAVPLDEESRFTDYLGNRMTCWHDDCKIPAKPREPHETDCTWVVRSADGNERRCLTEARWNTEAGALCTKHRNALFRKGDLAGFGTEVGDVHQGPEPQHPTDLSRLLDLDDEQAREFGVEVTGIRLSYTEPYDSPTLTLDVKLQSTAGAPLTGWTVDWRRFDGEDYLIDSGTEAFGASVLVGSNRTRGYAQQTWRDDRRTPLPSRIQVIPLHLGGRLRRRCRWNPLLWRQGV